MASSVVPFGDVAGDRVRDFLRQSGFDPQIIEWKYFDPAFNRDRNRGYAWLQQGRVAGVIGLIPFTIATGTRTRALHWSCDWMLADPDASPGMGIMLLKRAMAASEGV